MQTISINLIVPQGWHEFSDKQLRYVYQLSDEFDTDDKSCQREQCQACLDYAECSRNRCEANIGRDITGLVANALNDRSFFLR